LEKLLQLGKGTTSSILQLQQHFCVTAAGSIQYLALFTTWFHASCSRNWISETDDSSAQIWP